MDESKDIKEKYISNSLKYSKELLGGERGFVKREDIRKRGINPRNMIANQKKYLSKRRSFIRTFKRYSEKVEKIAKKSPLISPKLSYSKFIKGIVNDKKKKALKFLPKLLLAITLLIVRQKHVFKTLAKAYVLASKNFKDKTIPDNVFEIINQYIKLMGELNALDRLEQAVTLYVIFVEDIPSIINNIDSLKTESNQAKLYRELLQKGNALYKELIAKPKEDQGLKKVIERERDELKDLKKQIVELNNHFRKDVQRTDKIETVEAESVPVPPEFISSTFRGRGRGRGRGSRGK
ncbi:MAG TPA: hypothetical protein V6C58_14140 [Allocoleopsis sp.]